MKPPLPKHGSLKGHITDRHNLFSLLSGFGWTDADAPRTSKRWMRLPWVREFWREHAPELEGNEEIRASDDPEVTDVMVRNHDRRQRDRLDYLLGSGRLAGEAQEQARSLDESMRRAGR
jgi:hypothetical protein